VNNGQLDAALPPSALASAHKWMTGLAAMAIDKVLITLFFCVETLSRGLLLALIPIKLLEYFGNVQQVTFLYATVAVFGLGNSVFVPWLVRKLGVRMVIALAGVLISCAAILLATENILYVAFGLVIRIIAGACVEVPLTAYIMDRIPRHRLGAFEPWRLFFQASCIAFTPWLGIQLYSQADARIPFALVGICGIVMLGLALAARSALQESRTDVRYAAWAAVRFFRQPRLRLAWILAVIRASFWAIFNVYAPIFSLLCGWTPSAAAAAVSAGQGSLFLVGIWGRLARRFGARKMLMIGYFLAGLSLLATAATGVWAPSVAPFVFIATAFSASLIDGPGNVPFLRSTRPHERYDMAGVFMTYRDISQCAPVVMFSLILIFSPLTTTFAAYALVLFGAARLSRLLHPRLH
jgi:MFS family permease